MRTKVGDKMRRKKFLVFPLVLEGPTGVRESRWLEWVTIEYEFVAGCTAAWRAMRFVDETPETVNYPGG